MTQTKPSFIQYYLHRTYELGDQENREFLAASLIASVVQANVLERFELVSYHDLTLSYSLILVWFLEWFLF